MLATTTALENNHSSKRKTHVNKSEIYFFYQSQTGWRPIRFHVNVLFVKVVSKLFVKS